MFGWFTKKKEEKNSASIHQTIEGMRTTIDDLEKKEAQLQKKADEEVENARKFVQAKNRTAAGECLKKKKRYEEQMKRIQTQKDNIETQILQLESSALDVEVLKTQQKGAQAVKKAHGGLTVEKVEAAMDEIRDAMDNANDIGRSLGQSIGGGELIDEDDLEAELAGLQDELDDEEVGDDDLLAELKSLEVSKTTIKTTTKTNGVKATNTKTAVAVTTKTKKKSEEELELEKMMAEMA